MKIGHTQQQSPPALVPTGLLRHSGHPAGALKGAQRDTQQQGVEKSAGQDAAALSASAATATTASASAPVTVSAGARALARGAPERGGADMDSAKIDALRAAIGQGRFAVNHDAIADKLLAHARDMLAPPRG